MTSSRLYSLVTKHWPRIAAGLVVAIGLVEFVVGGMTADSTVEVYLMAWAGATGGLWFLFETAEKSLSVEVRSKVSSWVRSATPAGGISSIPAQFAILFDRVFGEKHFSLKCLSRSADASLLSMALVYVLLDSWGVPGLPDRRLAYAFGLLGVGAVVYETWLKPKWGAGPRTFAVLMAFSGSAFLVVFLRVVEADVESAVQGIRMAVASYAVAMVYNVAPDYLSLLQTRWALGVMARRGRIGSILVGDFLITWSIWVGAALMVGVAAFWVPMIPSGLWLLWPPSLLDWLFFSDDPIRGAYQLSFLTTFLTSVWLWLYMVSVAASRALLRMNAGVGFLLRVTDVESQPFRSMGFVSVIIVSALFALGLPLVLL